MTTRKWLLYTIPILMLLLFGAIFNGGDFLKKPFGSDDRLLHSIQQLEKETKEKNWIEAKKRSTYATKAWNKISNRVQYSVERDYMYDISGTLARIKGGIEAEDDKAIIEEIYYFYDLWDNLGE